MNATRSGCGPQVRAAKLDLKADLPHVRATVELLAGEALEQDHAERIQIRASVGAVRLAARTELRSGAAFIKIMTSGGVASPTDPPQSCTLHNATGVVQGSDVDGGLIAGRNMDGEVDLRKVTVSHFLLFAVEPSEPGQRRWVSAMWPGFVGTISGIMMSQPT